MFIVHFDVDVYCFWFKIALQILTETFLAFLTETDIGVIKEAYFNKSHLYLVREVSTWTYVLFDTKYLV